MKKGIAVVNEKICMCCGVCVAACPFNSLALTKLQGKHVISAYPEHTNSACTACGLCVKACPMDCISIETPA